MKSILLFCTLFFLVASAARAEPVSTPQPQAPRRAPFRLVFHGYNGDPKTDDPKKCSFQIDTVDLNQPSKFLKIGDTIANTPFKVIDFTFIIRKGVRFGEEDYEASEVTLENIKNGKKVVLKLGEVVEASGSL